MGSRIRENEITEEKLKAMVNGLYEAYCKEYGRPIRPLRQVVIGKLPDPEFLATTVQLLGKSYLSFSDEFIGTTHTKLLVDTIKHEFAHIWAGVEAKHGIQWKNWAKKFGAKVSMY
jgi:hypothetical protein